MFKATYESGEGRHTPKVEGELYRGSVDCMYVVIPSGDGDEIELCAETEPAKVKEREEKDKKLLDDLAGNWYLVEENREDIKEHYCSGEV
jgi:hypothetical protein